MLDLRNSIRDGTLIMLNIIWTVVFIQNVSKNRILTICDVIIRTRAPIQVQQQVSVGETQAEAFRTASAIIYNNLGNNTDWK
jgi:hypothetical protein